MTPREQRPSGDFDAGQMAIIEQVAWRVGERVADDVKSAIMQAITHHETQCALRRAEEQEKRTGRKRSVWSERLWGVSVTVAAIVFGWLLGQLAGCSPALTTVPGVSPTVAPTVAPAATATPENQQAVTAERIDRLEQTVTNRISQVQETVATTITTTIATSNYALDAERAKIEQSSLRKQERYNVSVMGVLVGFGLVALVAPSVITGRWRLIAYIVAASVLVGSVLLPFMWPF